jgi:hypothetical protein
MRQFVVIRKDELGALNGYFNGVEFVDSSSDSMLFPSAAAARSQAGILQKDDIDSEILVKGATLTIVVDA